MTTGVYKAIAAVSADIAKSGIAKDRQNAQQGYRFRGIDDCYNALAPILAHHALCILPVVEERTQVERTTAKGTVMFYTTVRVRFAFVSAEDGSSHEVVTFGEAMDSADKSTNKAMSAAYKYAVMQAFCIPTEGDNDADAQTPPDVKPIKSAKPPKPAAEKPSRFVIKGRQFETAGVTRDTLLELWNAVSAYEQVAGKGKGKQLVADVTSKEHATELTEAEAKAALVALQAALKEAAA